MTHLGVDGRDIFATQPRGIGQALTELYRHLLPLIPDWNVTLYTNRNGTVEFPAPAHTKKMDIRGDRFDAWERIRLPLAALTSRLDLLHCPSQTAPPFVPCPMVLTVHDLIPLRFEDGWSAHEVYRFRRTVARSVAKARRIIAVSECTRNDLVSEFGVPENKIDVIPWGVDGRTPNPASEPEWGTLSQSYGITSPFFLAFGGDAPRKNVERILRAMAVFMQAECRDAQLVIVGVRPSVKEKFSAVAKSLKIIGNVILLPYLTDEVISHLLMHCEALLYPSLYEGFGLPILEAMAIGAPVISSNVTSMPEIAGDAAILVDPREVHAISTAMRELFLNETAKGELRRRGFVRSKAFTWTKAAEETLASYSRALE